MTYVKNLTAVNLELVLKINGVLQNIAGDLLHRKIIILTMILLIGPIILQTAAMLTLWKVIVLMMNGALLSAVMTLPVQMPNNMQMIVHLQLGKIQEVVVLIQEVIVLMSMYLLRVVLLEIVLLVVLTGVLLIAVLILLVVHLKSVLLLQDF